MRKPLTIFVLLVTVLWQAMATASPLWSSGDDHEHASLHWVQAAHHHHDDGSFHQDDSPDAAQHAMVDVTHASPGLPACSCVVALFTGSVAPAPAHDRFRPPPFLEAPERPPRAQA